MSRGFPPSVKLFANINCAIIKALGRGILTLFRIALLSDLHAGTKAAAQPAGDVKLYSDVEHASPTEHPLYGLHALIEQECLETDAIVCPGDMTNKAEKQAINFVWRELHILKGKLKAKAIIATVGNHDVDSRNHSGDGFPRETLMRLVPSFPAGDDALSDHYWAHGYYICRVGEVRFLIINSCWLHEARDELNRGAITTYTLEKIAQELNQSSGGLASIAVLHHHPHPHTELGLGTDDVIQNGQALLSMLSHDGSWLVIHGHKHHPKIETAQGQFQPPFVLACGSFSGRLEGANAHVSRNYFHILEMDLGNHAARGRVLSWAWLPGAGWRRYQSSDGQFPTEFGFGREQNIDDIAQGIETSLGRSSFAQWQRLQRENPQIGYLMPAELAYLIASLEKKYGITVVYDRLGLPKQVGKGV